MPRLSNYARTRTILLCAALGLASRVPAQDLTLKLTVVTPTEVVDSAVVVIKSGRIEAVGPAAFTAEAVAIDGVLFPGLIDLHNHLTWNVLPNWTPPRLFTSRYEWQ